MTRDRLIFWAISFILVQTIYSYPQVRSDSSGADFLSFYASGRQANHGEAPLIYNIPKNFGSQAEVIGSPSHNNFNVFLYPPIFVLVCSLLASAPYLVAFCVWNAATLAFFAMVVQRITRDWKVVLALLSFPTILETISIGQNALLTAALLGGGTYLVERKPRVSGCLFGLLCYKPHFLLVVPVALFAARQWRALIALCATVTLLILLSVLAFGWSTWRAFIDFAPTVQRMTFDGTFGYWAYASWFSAVRLIGGSPALATSAQCLAIVIGVVATATIWYRPSPLAVRSATLVAATLLASPVVLSYDLTLAVIAAAWIFQDARRTGYLSWEKLVLGFVWVFPFPVLGLNIAQKLHLPLLSLIGIGLLAIAVRRSRTSSRQ
jgi:alpha-1,2-mannosyltransferase